MILGLKVFFTRLRIGECEMNSLFYWSTENNFHTLCPMELNYYKCASDSTVHSIELKFDRFIIGHRFTYYVDSGEFKIKSFFLQGCKKKS